MEVTPQTTVTGVVISLDMSHAEQLLGTIEDAGHDSGLVERPVADACDMCKLAAQIRAYFPA